MKKERRSSFSFAGKKLLFSVSVVAVLGIGVSKANAGDIYAVFPNGKKVDVSKIVKNYTAEVDMPTFVYMSNYDGKDIREFNEKFGDLGNPFIFGIDSYFGGVTYNQNAINKIVFCGGANCYFVKDGKVINKNYPRMFENSVLGYIIDNGNKDMNLKPLTDVLFRFVQNHQYGGGGVGTNKFLFFRKFLLWFCWRK
ncbi:hypothetical protein [Hippea alviniae]|uniref:hypothetical protein n=1 Tax=Hippea alviniae TaxID=1279027 RepID=UPI0003B5B25A|nr:hypothetical protein [Hippea alviniae]